MNITCTAQTHLDKSGAAVRIGCAGSFWTLAVWQPMEGKPHICECALHVPHSCTAGTTIVHTPRPGHRFKSSRQQGNMLRLSGRIALAAQLPYGGQLWSYLYPLHAHMGALQWTSGGQAKHG